MKSPSQQKARSKRAAQERASARANLVAAGARVFARKGLSSTRISDIAKEAGMATGALYGYFKDKEELYRAVVASGAERFTAVLGAAVSAEPNPKRKDLIAMREAMLLAETNPELFRILLQRGEVERAMYELMVSSIAGVREPQYAPGKVSGLFHKDLHETMSARAEVGVVFLVLDWWLDNRDKASRAEVLAAMSNFRRFGVERYGRGKPDWTSVQDAEKFLASFDPST